jgi:hypothetical protein
VVCRAGISINKDEGKRKNEQDDALRPIRWQRVVDRMHVRCLEGAYLGNKEDTLLRPILWQGS